MKRGYIQSINSTIEIQEIVKMMNNIGVESDKIVINQPFANFAKSVAPGDIVVVYSFDCFRNLAELVNATVKFSEQGIQLESLTDSWYDNSPELLVMLHGITELAYRLYIQRTQTKSSKMKWFKTSRLGFFGDIRKMIFSKKYHKIPITNIFYACAFVESISRNYFRYFK